MPKKDLTNTPATHDLCLYNSVLESEQALSPWLKEYTQLDKEIYLQKNIFFLFLCHYSILFALGISDHLFLASVTANVELWGSENFSKDMSLTSSSKKN